MNDLSPIPLDTETFAPKAGKIEGAFFREIDISKNLDEDISEEMSEIRLIPDGEALSVEAGKAFVIKTGETTWLRADFHQRGQMTGPLIYFETKIDKPECILGNSEAQARRMKSSMLSLSALIATFVILFAIFDMWSDSNFIKVALFGVAALACYNAATFIQCIVTELRGGFSALQALYKLEGMKPKAVPLSPFDRVFLKQITVNE
jgi:hypothetical protein